MSSGCALILSQKKKTHRIGSFPGYEGESVPSPLLASGGLLVILNFLCLVEASPQYILPSLSGIFHVYVSVYKSPLFIKNTYHIGLGLP